MKSILIAVLCIIVSASCKKTTSSNSTATSYCPTTAGSYWTYLRTASDTTYQDTTMTLTATNKDTVMNGVTYAVFNNSVGGPMYYGSSDKAYYRGGSLLAAFGLSELASFHEMYMTKNPTIDTAWSTTLTVVLPLFPAPIDTQKITLRYSIAATDISYTVLGNTYTKVSHVKLTSDPITISGTTIPPAATGDYYYAEGVGLISFYLKSVSPVTYRNVTTNFLLKSYSVK